MNFFTAMDILSSGLTAERIRMNVATSNLANANSTRSADGGPYKRLDPVFEAVVPHSADDPFSVTQEVLRQVEVNELVTDDSPPRMVHDPGHPDANEKGYVALPNVSSVKEMVNMMTASRAYEAGVTAMRALVDMAEKTLEG